MLNISNKFLNKCCAFELSIDLKNPEKNCRDLHKNIKQPTGLKIDYINKKCFFEHQINNF